MCAGTGEQVHLIIFTCARYAHEVRARRKNEERTERIKRMGIAGEKNKWREEKEGRRPPKKAERLKRKRRILFSIKKQEDARKGKKGQKTDALSRRRIQRTAFTSRQKIQELHTKKLLGLRKLIYHHVHAI